MARYLCKTILSWGTKMDAILILIILKSLGLVHLSWLGAIGYGLMIDFIIFIILIVLGD